MRGSNKQAINLLQPSSYNATGISPLSFAPPGGGDAPELEKQPLRSRRTPFANDRTLSAAGPVPHTDPRQAPCPKSAASRWLLSLLLCNAYVPPSYVRSAILTEKRLLHFQLRRNTHSSSSYQMTSLQRFSGTEVNKRARSAIRR